MIEQIKANRLYQWTSDSRKPIVVHEGGTSSGKTYAIMQYLLIVASTTYDTVITVVGQDIPNLKVGAYRDAKNIVDNTKLVKQHIRFHNKSERVYYFDTGSVIEFTSYLDEQDAKSGKRDYLFINEANGVRYGIFEQLNLRTSRKTIIDFNPSARFWAHKLLFGRSDVAWFNSTFKDNAFIDPTIKAKILSYEPTPENIKRGTANKYRWQVYGLGKVGKLEGLVFPNFEIVDYYPEDYKMRGFGMDFGYSNDPTTVTEIRYARGELFLYEWLYKERLKTREIYTELNTNGFPLNEKITSDVEPRLVDELNDLGLWVEQSEKGANSIQLGIKKMEDYKINIYYKSTNLIEEFNSYMWAKDRHGESLNKPIDKYNHGIDGARYGIMKMFDVKNRQSTAKSVGLSNNITDIKHEHTTKTDTVIII